MITATETGRSKKMITGLALGSIFLYSFANSTMSVLVNEIVDGFSLTGTSQGMMSSMFSVGSMVALLTAPLLQGRVSKMTVLLSATAFQALSLVFCGAAPTFLLFCITCSLLGMGGGLVDAYSNSLLVDVHKEESTRYLGYLHGLFGVGSLLAPLLMLRTLGWFSWRGTYFVLAGLMIVGLMVLIGACGRVRHTETARAARERVLRRQDFGEYIRTPRNIAVLVAAIFVVATQAGVLSWVLRYMAVRFDSETLGVTSISLFWICSTINRFSVSHIRVAPIRLLVIGAFLAATCLGIGVLTGSAWGMFVAMGVFGLCTGHFMQVLFSECAKGYEGRTTFVTSVLIVVMGITRSMIPLIMAYVSSSLSVAASMLLPVVAAVGVAVSGLFVARLPARQVERVEQVEVA